MLVFAGLGNPGAQYAGNRHNVGFMAVDEIHRRHGFSPWAKKFQGLVSDGMIDGVKVLLLKPQTFMNLSGQSVGAALGFYKLPLSALSVFYDEIDLPAGKVRVKTGGGSGGHNGIKSIDAHCGKDYRRVRIGVGHPGDRERVHGHVLGDFAKADSEWLTPLLEAIAENARYVAKGDDSGFMNRLALIGASGAKPEPVKPRGQSHIRPARPQQPAVKLPETGPMAGMLRRLFGGKDS